MSIPDVDYHELAHELLKRASEFDFEDRANNIDGDEFTRTEVLQDFAEYRLCSKLSPESAKALNAALRGPGHQEVEDVAKVLPRILKG